MRRVVGPTDPQEGLDGPEQSLLVERLEVQHQPTDPVLRLLRAPLGHRPRPPLTHSQARFPHFFPSDATPRPDFACTAHHGHYVRQDRQKKAKGAETNPCLGQGEHCAAQGHGPVLKAANVQDGSVVHEESLVGRVQPEVGGRRQHKKRGPVDVDANQGEQDEPGAETGPIQHKRSTGGLRLCSQASAEQIE